MIKELTTSLLAKTLTKKKKINMHNNAEQTITCKSIRTFSKNNVWRRKGCKSFKLFWLCYL